MKVKFEAIFGACMVLLAAVVTWAILSGSGSKAKTSVPVPTVASDAAVQTNVLATAALANKTAELTTNAPVLIAPVQSLSFGLDTIPVLQRQMLGQPVWEFVAALLFIFLAFYISKFLNYLVNARLKVWVAKTESKWDDLILEMLHGPVKVVAFVVLLHSGLRLSSFLSKGLQVLVAFSLTFLATRLVDLLIICWKEKLSGGVVDKSIDDMLMPVMRKTLKGFVIVVAVLVTSDNLGLDIKAVLATISVGSLALGLAAQDTLANMFGAVAIFIDKPFRIGDYIKIDSHEGAVETIGLRSTRIRNPDGFLVTIPNKTMGNATITNITQRPTIKSQFVLGVTYDTSNEKLKRGLNLLEEVYKKHPLTHDVWVTFKDFADSSLNIQVILWSKAKTMKENLDALQELNLTVKKRFEDEGLDFAFPSRTLYVKHESLTEKTDGNGSRTVSLPLERK